MKKISNRLLRILLAALPFVVLLVIYIIYVPNNIFDSIFSPVRFSFKFTDFSFMGHDVTEGPKLDTIMNQNNIEYLVGAVSDDTYYAKSDNGYNYIMCPANTTKELVNPDWTGDSYSSCYSVGSDNLTEITITQYNRLIDEYYDGIINIGDSYSDIMPLLQVDAIKKSGTYYRENHHVYYTCNSNWGKITFQEYQSGDRDEFETFNSVPEYLAEGHTVSYIIYKHPYRLAVTFGQDATVSKIIVSYDPGHLYEKYID